MSSLYSPLGSNAGLGEPRRHRVAERNDTRLTLGHPGSWTRLQQTSDGITISTDRFGGRPLFWHHRNDRYTVSETIWPLAGELDPFGVADFLLFGYGLADRTIFRDVKVTQPDSVLQLTRRGAFNKQESWPEPIPVRPGLVAAVSALVEQMAGLLDPFRLDTPLLVGLSGGLDSRVLLALASGRDLLAYTFTHSSGSDDELIARRIAGILKADHEVFGLDVETVARRADDYVRRTEGQLSFEHVHGYGVLDQIPIRYETMLNGAWGENGPGGALLLPEGTQGDIPAIYLKRMLARRPPQGVANYAPDGWLDWALGNVSDWYQQVGGKPRFAGLIDSRNRPSRLNVWWHYAALPQRDCVWPFLNEDLLRVCYGMEERWQRNSLAYRHAIRQMWPKLGRVKWQKTGLRLSRYPGKWTKRRMRLLGQASTAFTNPGLYARALRGRLTTSERELAPKLVDLGIDVPGLLAAHPAETSHGRSLRLRLATIDTALRLAQDAP